MDKNKMIVKDFLAMLRWLPQHIEENKPLSLTFSETKMLVIVQGASLPPTSLAHEGIWS